MMRKCRICKTRLPTESRSHRRTCSERCKKALQRRLKGRDARGKNETDSWMTPDYLFKQLDDEFHFDVDVCASAKSKKCSQFYSIEEDGLKQDWRGVCWCNAPFSEVAKWLRKAYEASLSGKATVVCLVKVATDTKWWREHEKKASEIRFIDHRVKFIRERDGKQGSAPQSHALMIFRPPGERTEYSKAMWERMAAKEATKLELVVWRPL